jgi:hypothetical protein
MQRSTLFLRMTTRPGATGRPEELLSTLGILHLPLLWSIARA